MAERKVINKYFPPDFDPVKLQEGKRLMRRNAPKTKQQKQMNVRMMYPFTLRCNSCKEFTFIGTKFNSRVERCLDENYLGIAIWRFYGRCGSCHNELIFKTDPKNGDYIMESGGVRTYAADLDKEKVQEILEEKDKEDTQGDRMKQLQAKSYDTQNELEAIQQLDRLRKINKSLSDRDKAVHKALKKYRAPPDLTQEDELEILKMKNEVLTGSFENAEFSADPHHCSSSDVAPTEKTEWKKFSEASSQKNREENSEENADKNAQNTQKIENNKKNPQNNPQNTPEIPDPLNKLQQSATQRVLFNPKYLSKKSQNNPTRNTENTSSNNIPTQTDNPLQTRQSGPCSVAEEEGLLEGGGKMEIQKNSKNIANGDIYEGWDIDSHERAYLAGDVNGEKNEKNNGKIEEKHEKIHEKIHNLTTEVTLDNAEKNTPKKNAEGKLKDSNQDRNHLKQKLSGIVSVKKKQPQNVKGEACLSGLLGDYESAASE